MSRPETEVRAEVAGLGVTAHRRQLESLAEALRDSERVIDWVTGRPRARGYLDILGFELRSQVGMIEVQARWTAGDLARLGLI